jgi:hypothetical protein
MVLAAMMAIVAVAATVSRAVRQASGFTLEPDPTGADGATRE